MPQSFLFVRSADRSLGTSSSFRVALPQTYAKVTAVSLIAAETPFSFYNVSAPYLEGVTFTHNSVAYVFSLQTGFYDISDLCAYMLAALQSAFPSAGVSSVNYSKTSGRIYLTYTSGLTFSVQSNGNGNLGRIVGTDASGVATLGAGGVLAFPAIATLAPTSTIFVRIAELPSQMASTNGQHAAFRLQLSGAPGSIVMANAASSVYNTNVFTTPVANLSTLTVSLYTADGIAVDMHAVEWTFTLLIASS